MGKGFFREHAGLKLIALALALLLEVYFYSPDNSVGATLFAPIEVGALPAGTMVIEPLNLGRGLAAEVQVRGPKSLIDQVKSASHRFMITAPNNAAEEFMATLDPAQLSIPTGVEIVRMRPERIKVRTEREVTRELPVVVDRIGDVPAGYRVDNVNVFPARIVVRGPQSECDALDRVETMPVDVSKFTSTLRRQVGLKTLSQLVSASAGVVAVDIEVNPIPFQRSIQGVDVEVLAPESFAATVQPSRVAVMIEGPEDLVKQVSRSGIKLVADGRTLSAGKHEIKLSATLPEGVKVLKTEPARVQVTLENSGRK